MGSVISSVLDRLASLGGKEERRLLILGLDAAGKTTALMKMKTGESLVTVPTIGFNCETLEYKNISFTAWDIGGQDKIRQLWKHYYRNTDCLLYIVDSTDADRMELARTELHRLLAADELRDAKLLVWANKQDLPEAMTPAQVADKMGLYSIGRERDWYVQGCTATKGEGLYEGLDWVAGALKGKPSAAAGRA